MKKFTLGLTAAVLALGAGAGALYAAPGMMDGDAAKTVTWAEAQAKSAEMFAKLDINKDGVLSPADRDAKMGEMFDKIDANHDGAISKDEFIAHHRGMMGGAGMEGGPMGGHDMGGDHDKGGHDMAGPGGRGMGMHGKHMDMDSPREGGRMGGGMGGGAMMMARMADTNKDGQITRAEYDTAVKAHFEKVDKNHDGKITPAERKAAHDAMRAMRHDRMGGQGAGPTPPHGN